MVSENVQKSSECSPLNKDFCESADQSLPVSKGVIPFLLSIFPLKKNGGRGGRGLSYALMQNIKLKELITMYAKITKCGV